MTPALESTPPAPFLLQPLAAALSPFGDPIAYPIDRRTGRCVFAVRWQERLAGSHNEAGNRGQDPTPGGNGRERLDELMEVMRIHRGTWSSRKHHLATASEAAQRTLR
jgi:hypothetical protein